MPLLVGPDQCEANALFGAVSGVGYADVAAIGSTMGPLEAKDKVRQELRGRGQHPVGAVRDAHPAEQPDDRVLAGLPHVDRGDVRLRVRPWPDVGRSLHADRTLRPASGPELKLTDKVSASARVPWSSSLVKATPALLLIVVADRRHPRFGIFTPTEGSCIAVVHSLALSFLYRSIKVKQLPGMLLDATRTTAVVMFLIGVSSIMGFVLSFAEIPALQSSAMFSISDNPVILLLLIAVVLLIVGCFMDLTPAVLIFTPIFLPIVVSFGINSRALWDHDGGSVPRIGTITPRSRPGPVHREPKWQESATVRDVFRRLPLPFGALVVDTAHRDLHAQLLAVAADHPRTHHAVGARHFDQRNTERLVMEQSALLLTSSEHIRGMELLHGAAGPVLRPGPSFVDDDECRRPSIPTTDRIVLVGVSPVTKVPLELATSSRRFAVASSSSTARAGSSTSAAMGAVTVDGTHYRLTKGSCLRHRARQRAAS